MLLLSILMGLCLAFICYQDLKYRTVYWWAFPVLALLMFSLKCSFSGWQEALIHTGYGMLFLSLQLAVLWGYFSIKNKKLINLTNNYLGWGDVLFLVAISCYLSPGNYVVFYVVSLLVVLVYILLTELLSGKQRNPHIPLAGLQAALLGLLMLVDYNSPKFMLYDDSWLSF